MRETPRLARGSSREPRGERGARCIGSIDPGRHRPYATSQVAGTNCAQALVVDLLQALPGYAHDKVEGIAVIDNFTIAISNDDDFGVGDDGAGNFIAKSVPLFGDAQDRNTIYILRLTTPLKD